MQPLKDTEQKVFSIVKAYFADYGVSPMLEQIRSRLGVKSINTITRNLKSLERKGYIFRRKHARRSIEIIGFDEKKGKTVSTISLPVVASVGCDDLSVIAQENYGEFLDVDKDLVKDPTKDFILRVIGDSMNDAEINSGDYVLVERTEQANSGDRIVAIVDNMATVKRLQKTDKATILWPESKDPKYKPIILKENYKIAGKVICTIQNPYENDTRVVYDQLINK